MDKINYKNDQLPMRLRHSCKLTEDIVEMIRESYNHGVEIKSLARAFNVSWATIYYWVDEEYRQRHLKPGKNYSGKTKFYWSSMREIIRKQEKEILELKRLLALKA